MSLSTQTEVRKALDAGTITLAQAIDASDAVRHQTGKWVSGCGGTETPFKFEGQTYLYCWHTGTGKHAYLHVESDTIMPDDWHPQAAPLALSAFKL